MTDHLIDIFIEAAHRASLIPLASEATVYAMKSFGNHAMEAPIVAAILGGLAGHGFNLMIGRWLMKLPNSPKHHDFFQKLQLHFNRYGFVLLLLAPLALGNILTTLAGMLGTPLKKAVPMIGLGLVVYYGRLIF